MSDHFSLLNPTMIVLNDPDDPDVAFGSVLMLQWDDKNMQVFLFQLLVNKGHRRKGKGKALIEKAIEWAGDRAVILSPKPFADEPMTEDQLVAYYKQFGFVEVDPKDVGYNGEQRIMRRLPDSVFLAG